MVSRIACLVLCAVAPRNASRMCAHFADERFQFFLHCDAKRNLGHYLDRFSPVPANATFIEPRHEVFWGGFSMLDATIELMRAAMRDCEIQHFALLSDDSFPLLPPDLLHARIAGSAAPWIVTWPVPADHLFQQRYRRFFYLDSVFSNPRWALTEERHFTQRDRDALARLDARRRAGKVPIDKLHAGKQWWVLHRRHVAAMLEFHDTQVDFQDSFRFSAVPDEIYLQTMFRILFPSDPVAGNPMYDDSTRVPNPYVFDRAEQYTAARESNRLFVRKVAEDGEDYLAAVLTSWS